MQANTFLLCYMKFHADLMLYNPTRKPAIVHHSLPFRHLSSLFKPSLFSLLSSNLFLIFDKFRLYDATQSLFSRLPGILAVKAQ